MAADDKPEEDKQPDRALFNLPVVHPDQFKVGMATDEKGQQFVVLGFIKGTDELTFALPDSSAEELANAILAHVLMIQTPLATDKKRLN